VPVYTAERESQAKLYGLIEERLLGLEDIRTNGGGGYAMHRFYEVSNRVYDRVLKSEIMGEVLRAITTLMFAFGYALAMGMGIYLYREGTFTIGAVYLVFHYTSMLREPLFQISQQIDELQKATAGFKRIEELHRTTSAIVEGTQVLPSYGPLGIVFDDVTFAYNPGDPVLQDVSFALAPGRVMGLLGRTGSGKTTITRLLFRFYDVQRGQIRLNDMPLDDVRLESLRRRVGLVTQDVQLFNATMRENLALFRPEVSDDRMIAVLEELGLGAWFSALPEGLDTVLNAGSTGLSAGEAQLLAFARVFLKDPGLVILDEPSSRLDPATEQHINRAVEKLLHNRTGIIIAHRLDTVQKVDDIMILESGRIVEFGARAELAGNGDSHFSRLLKTGIEDLMS